MEQNIGQLAAEALEQATNHVRSRLGVQNEEVIRAFAQSRQYAMMVELMAAYVLAEGIRHAIATKMPIEGQLADVPSVH